MAGTVHCPNCDRPVEWSERFPYRPFCSKRCKLIDLGGWFDGSNHIPGPELEDESISELDPHADPANEDER